MKEFDPARYRGDEMDDQGFYGGAMAEGRLAGREDARRHDDDPENFEPTPNPYGIETEAELHELWDEEWENAFEGNITKPYEPK